MTSFAKILQVSDFHFVKEITNKGRKLHTNIFKKPHEYAKLQSLSRRIDSEQRPEEFDVVLATGDLSTDGPNGALTTFLAYFEKEALPDVTPPRRWQ